MDSHHNFLSINKKAKRARAIYSCNACHVQLEGHRARDNHNTYVHHGVKQTYTITEESEASIPISLVSATKVANLNKTSISTSQSVDSIHQNLLPMKRAFEENASDVNSSPSKDIIADEDNEAFPVEHDSVQAYEEDSFVALSDAAVMADDAYVNVNEQGAADCDNHQPSSAAIEKLLSTPYNTSGVFPTTDARSQDPSCVYQDRSSYKGLTKAQLYSLELFDIMQQYSIPREAHRNIVRLMNSMITGHNEMISENRKSKILHCEAVERMLSKRANFGAHLYDTCPNGCYLFNNNNLSTKCPVCNSARYKDDNITAKVPAQSIKLLSIGDIFSKLLSNDSTRELLLYRSKYQRHSKNGKYQDYFDGSAYQDCLNKGLFKNPDDQAVALFVDGFVNSKRGAKKYTMIHLVLLNYSPGIRYKQSHHVQLGIVASNGKVAIDSYLQPILSELHYLEQHGMKIAKRDGTSLSAKCYMVFLGGDIPGLKAISKAPSHQSYTPCKDCKRRATRAVNRKHGLYLPYQQPSPRTCQLRTIQEYKQGDPHHGIHSVSLLSGMKLFNGAAFGTMDELHTIARGVGSLILEVLTVDSTKETKFFHKMHPNQDIFNSQQYPFFIAKSKLDLIGKAIEDSRQYIPTSFLGSCTNYINNKQGIRAVDLSDYLLHYIPALFVPQLSSIPAQQAILRLIRGCSIALSWSLSENTLDEMDACFVSFYQFCNKQISLQNLSATIYRPVLHYLQHVSSTIRCHGPLRVSSCRSLERTIGSYKKLMTAKIPGQSQPSNLIEKVMLRSLLGHSLDISEEANLICPPGYSDNTWEEHGPDDEGTDRQLWNPFEDVVIRNDQIEFQGVKVAAFRRALSKFYRRQCTTTTTSNATILEPIIQLKVAGRAWIYDKLIITSQYYSKKNREFRRGNNYVFFTSPFLSQRGVSLRGWYVGAVLFFFKHEYQDKSQFLAFVEVMKMNEVSRHNKSFPVVLKARPSEVPKFAVISVDEDIMNQVGLVKTVGSEYKFSVIVPNDHFDGDTLSNTCGLLANL